MNASKEIMHLCMYVFGVRRVFTASGYYFQFNSRSDGCDGRACRESGCIHDCQGGARLGRRRHC